MALQEIDLTEMSEDDVARLEEAAALWHKIIKQLLPMIEDMDRMCELYYSVFPQKASDPNKRVDGLIDQLQRQIQEA